MTKFTHVEYRKRPQPFPRSPIGRDLEFAEAVMILQACHLEESVPCSLENLKLGRFLVCLAVDGSVQIYARKDKSTLKVIYSSKHGQPLNGVIFDNLGELGIDDLVLNAARMRFDEVTASRTSAAPS